jgi:MFS family permease
MSPPVVSKIRFTRALGSPPFALLWSGQTISALGDGAYITALGWEVLLLTRSAGAMGLVLVASSTPRLIFLLLGGVTADRVSRRTVMLCSDAGRALAVLAIAVLSWANVLQLWHLVVLSLLFGLVSAFFMPANQSIPPQLLDSELLPSANALTGLSREAGMLAGPVLGAGLVALFNPAVAFAFDGLTFVVSALCLVFLRLPDRFRSAPKPADRAGAGRGLRGVTADVREGLAYITSSTWLWVIIAIASVQNVASSGIVVALPKLVSTVYHQGVWLLGAIGAATAVGTIVATLIIGQATHLRRRGLLACLGLLTAFVAYASMGVPLAHNTEPVAATSAAAIFGFGLGVFDIIWVTTLQELVPSEKLGRVFSIDMLGSFALLPVGYAVIGALTDRVGPGAIFLAGGAINVVFTLVALAVPGVRRLQ